MHENQAKTLDSMQTLDEVSQLTESNSSVIDGELAFTMQMIQQKIKTNEGMTEIEVFA